MKLLAQLVTCFVQFEIGDAFLVLIMSYGMQR